MDQVAPKVSVVSKQMTICLFPATNIVHLLEFLSNFEAILVLNNSKSVFRFKTPRKCKWRALALSQLNANSFGAWPIRN